MAQSLQNTPTNSVDDWIGDMATQPRPNALTR